MGTKTQPYVSEYGNGQLVDKMATEEREGGNAHLVGFIVRVERRR